MQVYDVKKVESVDFHTLEDADRSKSGDQHVGSKCYTRPRVRPRPFSWGCDVTEEFVAGDRLYRGTTTSLTTQNYPILVKVSKKNEWGTYPTIHS